ncbi:hypothetical protein LTR10_018230 [Elasticomyces elasticus]|uniref:Transcription factor domain-containing protein n=1 Tax=Exophiala sideris TaxID=1016849 RepID=A0ABR0JIW5_9EURO|nr:hypothetical protein LTR10_018230 [Elasticomyces elasticus]KAK5034529.1 hypothetical protein LTS07_003450 [Exophiala sideris]KAK5042825.1 hypothetical protein LTR13_001673 [Exophiala sideris]KAK5065908.1 hypothetical protein LTR69_003458 [Exophiala sideris]KAK5185631.1 hypothetical protein LTR44_001680 [Eurotiomycetes sp. CCFEE 6388]
MIKVSDLRMLQLSHSLQTIAADTESLEAQIYCSLLELLSLGGNMTENQDVGTPRLDIKAYLSMAGLDRELNEWYSRLPPRLKWRPSNIQVAPASFFLLHHHFYSLLVMLHRPFAQFHIADLTRNTLPDKTSQYPELRELSCLSRKVCLDNAIRVARIFKYHCTRFQGNRQIFITGIDHATTAATSLIAALAHIQDPGKRATPLRYLRCIADAMKGLASANRAAERMAKLLEDVFKDLSWTHSGLSPTPISVSSDRGSQRPNSSTPMPPLDSSKRRWNADPDKSIPQSVATTQENTNPLANHNGTSSFGNYPNKRYFRTPNANAGPGFGLDSILPLTGVNYAFFDTSTNRMNEMDDLNMTDPLFFDDDFNTITIDGTDQAGSTNRTVEVNPMEFFGDTRAIPALVTYSANDSLNKLDCGPPTQLLNGAPSAQWMSQTQQTSQASRPRAPDWSSRYNDVPSYLG